MGKPWPEDDLAHGRHPIAEDERDRRAVEAFLVLLFTVILGLLVLAR